MKTLGLITILLGMAGQAVAGEPPYPTVTRVEYVLGCMVRNGETGEMMYRCSCVIDRIASDVPLEDFDRVMTIMKMRRVPGERAGMFRDVAWMEEAMVAFEAIEHAASVACFPR